MTEKRTASSFAPIRTLNQPKERMTAEPFLVLNAVEVKRERKEIIPTFRHDWGSLSIKMLHPSIVGTFMQFTWPPVFQGLPHVIDFYKCFAKTKCF